MTIKEYIQALEDTKQRLLSLKLPDNTQLVTPPDMGCMIQYENHGDDFYPVEVFKEKENSCNYYKYPYVCGNEMKLTEKVVIIH